MKSDRYCVHVPVGDGAVHAIANPVADPHVEWILRYRTEVDMPARVSAASVLDSFDYLLSENISTKEAIRRLRLLRYARFNFKLEHL